MLQLEILEIDGRKSMADIQIIKKAIEEVESKTFGTTQQILEVHEVVYTDNQPQVLRVDREKEDGTAIVYFPVRDERFYLAVYLDTEPQVAVRGVETEPHHSVYFRATSETLSFEELSSLTTLQPTGGWSKGEKRRWGNTLHDFSSFHLEPNPEPDEFEDKLEKLLSLLEQDQRGTIQLVESMGGYIQVASIFHNGNTMLGGHHINTGLLKRLAALNLAIDFDLYAEGIPFKE